MDIPLPDGNSGPTYTYGDFKNISIFNTCKHPDEAWAFTKYLVSPHSDLRPEVERNGQPVLAGPRQAQELIDAYFDELAAAAATLGRRTPPSAPTLKGLHQSQT